jgi:NADH-quinone oxidoreductase subunit A
LLEILMALIYGPVAIITAVASIVAVASLVVAWIVRPHDPYAEKQETYECGMSPVGEAWGQFYVRYYLIALVFVIFDVEAIFLFPWATVFKRLSAKAMMGAMPTLEVGVFILILLAGLAYVWRKGDLEWTR